MVRHARRHSTGHRLRRVASRPSGGEPRTDAGTTAATGPLPFGPDPDATTGVASAYTYRRRVQRPVHCARQRAPCAP